MNNNRKIFITGIGTDVGKTIVSAILVQTLGYDYWKPIQAGNLDNSDSKHVKKLIDRNDVTIHEEFMKLSQPLSPHIASEMDNKHILLKNIKIPVTKHGLVIEGAGGLMVPINNEESIIDLIEKIKADVVIVSKHYLGSINHSLLTFEALKSRNIPVAGWVFNGDENQSTENIILNKSNLPKLFSIKNEVHITRQVINKYSQEILKSVNNNWIEDMRS
ncbi:MAG: dethiobiotin synthase [Spirochaetia bacterium]|nr:dethiobiotin synthase [Spirochaetia bacterium]